MLNMEAVLNFDLTLRGSIINNFEARYTTIILIIFGTKIFGNVTTFISEKMLIYTCVELPVGETRLRKMTVDDGSVTFFP